MNRKTVRKTSFAIDYEPLPDDSINYRIGTLDDDGDIVESEMVFEISHQGHWMCTENSLIAEGNLRVLNDSSHPYTVRQCGNVTVINFSNGRTDKIVVRNGFLAILENNGTFLFNLEGKYNAPAT